jgi:hypothetical protein
MADKDGYMIPAERIDNAILELRGERVMLTTTSRRSTE